MITRWFVLGTDRKGDYLAAVSKPISDRGDADGLLARLEADRPAHVTGYRLVAILELDDPRLRLFEPIVTDNQFGRASPFDRRDRSGS